MIVTFFYTLLSALVACFITYKFTIRSKKHDIILQERILAFKTIHKELVFLSRYCHAIVASRKGNEFAPRLEDLSEDVKKSALTHWTYLQEIVDENLIFLPSRSKKLIDEIFFCLSILSNIELQLAYSDPPEEVVISAPEAYENAIDKIDLCLENLFNELKLPI